jgi:hypothetical protein
MRGSSGAASGAAAGCAETACVTAAGAVIRRSSASRRHTLLSQNTRRSISPATCETLRLQRTRCTTTTATPMHGAYAGATPMNHS